VVGEEAPLKLAEKWNWKYATLLPALLCIYFVVPFLGGSSSNLPAFRFTLLTVMFLCVLALAKHRAVLYLAVALAMASELSLVVNPAFRSYVQMAFFVLASAVVLFDVMTGEDATTDRVLGAMCGYLLLGILFALFYQAMEQSNPGCFKMKGGSEFSDFIYFSIVTLSTLGYGDILPVSPQARALVSLEVVLGQFYLAVVVARLVALSMYAREKP
jgi:hypothetical protein